MIRTAILLLALLLAGAPLAEEPLEPAAGRLLVADRSLRDPNFERSVVLLLAYDENGAMGLIVNRPTEVKLSHALPDVDEGIDGEEPVWFGGPVSPGGMRMLFRSQHAPKDSEAVLDDVHVSGSRKLLKRLARLPVPLKVFAGYAGWAAGQLDSEIARGDWHVVEGSPDLVFSDEPFRMWQRLAPPSPRLRTRAGERAESRSRPAA